MYLIEHSNLSINCVDKDLMTPLHTVCSYGNSEMANLLISHGSHIEMRDKVFFVIFFFF